MYSEGPFLSKVKQNTAKKNTWCQPCLYMHIGNDSLLYRLGEGKLTWISPVPVTLNFYWTQILRLAQKSFTEPAHQPTTFLTRALENLNTYTWLKSQLCWTGLLQPTKTTNVERGLHLLFLPLLTSPSHRIQARLAANSSVPFSEQRELIQSHLFRWLCVERLSFSLSCLSHR